MLVGTESLRLAVYAVDIRAADHAPRRESRGRRAYRVRVLAWGRPDGLGDEGIIPDGVKVWSTKREKKQRVHFRLRWATKRTKGDTDL